MSPIEITSGLAIPDDELRFVGSRSSGPGGQNVNKVESRVTLLFDLEASPSLSDRQKELVRTRLATRINKQGVLRVVSQRHRTRAANVKAVRERFAELLAAALRRDPPRRPTRPPAAAERRRLEEKRRRAKRKRERSRPGWGQE